MPNNPHSVNHKLSVIALTLACLSILLATVPQYVIEKKIRQLNEIVQSDDPVISVEIKGVKLKFGHKKHALESQNLSDISKLKELSQKITISVYIIAILSIFLGVSSLTKKQTREVGVCSIIIACVALAWEYVAAGITLGVAVVIALFLLINLS